MQKYLSVKIRTAGVVHINCQNGNLFWEEENLDPVSRNFKSDLRRYKTDFSSRDRAKVCAHCSALLAGGAKKWDDWCLKIPDSGSEFNFWRARPLGQNVKGKSRNFLAAVLARLIHSR
jgi:hypothetical protein